MNQWETAEILALISQYNGMTVDKARTLAWHDMVGNLDFEDAVKAVKDHFRTSTEWLQPAHLIAGVKAIRAAAAQRERVEAAKSRPALPAPPQIGEQGLAAKQAIADLGMPRKKNALKIGGSMGSCSSGSKDQDARRSVPKSREPQPLGVVLQVVSDRMRYERDGT